MKDLFYIPIDEKCIIYMPQRDLAFYADKEAIPIVDKIRNGEVLSIEDQKSVIFQQIDKIRDKYPRVKELIDKPKFDETNFLPTKAIIIPTETCNLGCTYCYASAMPIKDKISWEFIENTIEFITKNAITKKGKAIGITFYGGGEPTLQWNYIEQAVDLLNLKCKNHKLEHNCTIITNGTLLTENRIDWIIKNNINIQISFDVLPDVQLVQRPFANEKNSHSKVVETINLFQEKKYKINLRCTITENNLLSMSETVNYIFDNFKSIKTIHLEPSTTIGRSLSTSTYEPNDTVFIREFIKAFELGQELGIYVYCSMSDNVGKIKSRFCNTEFTVTSNGAITACHRYSREETPNSKLFMYGKFNAETKKFDVDLEKLNNIDSFNGKNYSNCKDCYAQYNCAGDCLSTRVSQDEVLKDGQRCNIVRELLKYDLLRELNS